MGRVPVFTPAVPLGPVVVRVFQFAPSREHGGQVGVGDGWAAVRYKVRSTGAHLPNQRRSH